MERSKTREKGKEASGKEKEREKEWVKERKAEGIDRVLTSARSEFEADVIQLLLGVPERKDRRVHEQVAGTTQTQSTTSCLFSPRSFNRKE